MVRLNNKINKIVDFILENNGFVFGGFVRDLVRDVSPNDIDCCLSYNNLINLISILTGELGYVKLLNFNSYFKFEYYGYSLTRMLVPINETEFQIDVVDNPLIKPDFDVNMLVLDRSGIKVNYSYHHNLELSDIFSNIYNKRCVKLPDCLEHRVEKMRDRGWDIINK